MKREFVENPTFTKLWEAYGLSVEDLRELENVLLQNPKIGDVMQGTNGLRKFRFALRHSGKSNGARVCYLDLEEEEVIFLFYIFKKKDQENLTKEQRNRAAKIISMIKDEFKEG